MCGIFGIIDFDKISDSDEKRIRLASEIMITRGPDYQGFYKDEEIYFGLNRLKIIDLTDSANQPFVFENRYVIVYNGEIFNYREVRSLLEKEGVFFKTNSDTEVLIAGYVRYGERILKMLRGMWAFVIWDKKEKQIFASRDRFGEKPFYYIKENNRLVFASNIGGISRLMNNYELNINAVSELIGSGFISSHHSILKGVSKLKAAHNLHFSKSEFSVNKYWEIDYSDKIDISFKDTLITVEDLLQKSVEEKLISSDVEVGLFLSSGIDSSLISALAGQYSKNIKTITLAASDKFMDESRIASKIALHLGLDNEIVQEQDDYFSVLNEMYTCIEPIADSSILPAYSVSKAAKGKFTVVLTGDGGDEIFGGYTNAIKALGCSYDKTILSPFFDFCIDQKFNPDLSFLNKVSSTHRIFRYSGFLSYLKRKDQLSDYIKNKVFTPKAINGISITKGENFILGLADGKALEYHDKVLLNGINTTLVDDFLYKMDSSTMANSIESRSPFLDHRIVEFTSKLKTKGLMPNKIDKEITKTLLYKYVPKEIIDIPKRGFSIPVKQYFKGPWASILIQKLNSEKIKELNIFNNAGIVKLLENYKKNDFDQLEKVFFGILSFVIWFETFHEN